MSPVRQARRMTRSPVIDTCALVPYLARHPLPADLPPPGPNPLVVARPRSDHTHLGCRRAALGLRPLEHMLALLCASICPSVAGSAGFAYSPQPWAASEDPQCCDYGDPECVDGICIDSGEVPADEPWSSSERWAEWRLQPDGSWKLVVVMVVSVNVDYLTCGECKKVRVWKAPRILEWSSDSPLTTDPVVVFTFGDGSRAAVKVRNPPQEPPPGEDPVPTPVPARDPKSNCFSHTLGIHPLPDPPGMPEQPEGYPDPESSTSAWLNDVQSVLDGKCYEEVEDCCIATVSCTEGACVINLECCPACEVVVLYTYDKDKETPKDAEPEHAATNNGDGTFSSKNGMAPLKPNASAQEAFGEYIQPGEGVIIRCYKKDC